MIHVTWTIWYLRNPASTCIAHGDTFWHRLGSHAKLLCCPNPDLSALVHPRAKRMYHAGSRTAERLPVRLGMRIMQHDSK